MAVVLSATTCVPWACSENDDAVVVYCSVDEQFARGILKEFETRMGVRAVAVFDSEAGKTTGLINRIRAERGRPRADVLFSGELFNTMLLAREGLLASYDPPTAADIPSSFRDDKHRWTAIGVRGRVLAFDANRTKPSELPERWEQLADPQWAPHLAMANPLFGTTRGHVAAMFAAWGAERATAFLTRLHEGGVLVVDGNSSAVRAVIDGRVKMCMTDTDDVWVARREAAGRASLDLRYLDMGDGGTLWIPSTVAIINGARHEADARRLVNFLVSADVERMLAESDSRNVPVRAWLRESLSHLRGGGMTELKRSKVSYADIAAAMDESARVVREVLLK